MIPRLPYCTRMFVDERDGQAIGNHVLLDVLAVVPLVCTS